MRHNARYPDNSLGVAYNSTIPTQVDTHIHIDKYVNMYYNSIFIYIKIYIQKLIKCLCLSSFNHTTLPPLEYVFIVLVHYKCLLYNLPVAPL